MTPDAARLEKLWEILAIHAFDLQMGGAHRIANDEADREAIETKCRAADERAITAIEQLYAPRAAEAGEVTLNGQRFVKVEGGWEDERGWEHDVYGKPSPMVAALDRIAELEVALRSAPSARAQDGKQAELVWIRDTYVNALRDAAVLLKRKPLTAEQEQAALAKYESWYLDAAISFLAFAATPPKEGAKE